MFVTDATKGWVHAYPSISEWNPDLVRSIANAAKVDQAIAFMLHDSDVLSYWYFDGGELADTYNSCPDYYGKASKADMAAVGDAEAFRKLLPEKAARNNFAKVISGRLINGEWTAPGPDFEDDRLAKLASLLSIDGVMGFYDYIKEGDEVEGVGTASNMHEVG